MGAEIKDTIKFNVENISVLSETEKFSKIHYVGNIPWRLEVKAPVTEQSGYGKYLCINLHCKESSTGPMWSIDIDFEARLLSSIGGRDFSARFKNLDKYCSKIVSWGWSKFLNWDDLINPNNGYVQNDIIRIEATVTIKKVVGIHRSGLDVSKPSKWSDQIMIVGGKQVQINREYMSMMSPVLKARFLSTISGNIELDDVDYDDFVQFLKAVYHIPLSINTKNVENMLKLADRFQVEYVFYQSEQILLSDDEIPLTKKFLLADKYCLAMLHNNCLKLLKAADIETIKNDERFSDMTVGSKESLLEVAIRFLKVAE